MTSHIINSFSCSADVELGAEIILHGIEDFADLDDAEDELYFTHSDHLGSSSFITVRQAHCTADASGEAVQHLQYLPFGESFVSQTSTSWQTRYTFSGKEKDAETGYSYFGARYYDSEGSIWLSVDPMADKYPSMSAYMYCAGNPVMLVDPKGLEGKHIGNKFWNWARGHGWEDGKYSGTFWLQDKLTTSYIQTADPSTAVTNKQYIRFWEETHGVKITKKQRKEVLPTGCIGLVRIETGYPQDKKPDISNSFDNLKSAQDYATQIQNDLKNCERVIIFSFEFNTDNDNDYQGDPETHRVTLKSQKIYKKSFYNYSLYDPNTDTWWGANDGTKKMKIYIKSQAQVEIGIPAFNHHVYSVTITKVP